MNYGNGKRLLLGLGLTLLALSLSAVIFESLFQAGPTAVLPENLDRLDPDVVLLIERQAREINVRPYEPEGHGILGLMFEANTLWEEARQSFAIASSLAPDAMLWRYHLAIATRQAGNFQEALDIMRALAHEYPSFAPVQQRLGEASLEIGDLGAAVAAFRRLIELSPQAPDGYVGLGGTLLGQKNYVGAARLLEHAVAIDPRYPLARYRLGMAYRGLGRQEEAQIEASNCDRKI